MNDLVEVTKKKTENEKLGEREWVFFVFFVFEGDSVISTN